MAAVLIVYATTNGNTRQMAETIAAGAASVESTTVAVRDADEATEADVLAADALILGSPVHMSSVDWRMKRFIDNICGSLWRRDALVGRVGAAFVAGGGLGNAGAGCEFAMLSLLTNLAECGLILIPLPKTTPGYNLGGLQWAPYARTKTEDMAPYPLTEERLAATYHHGIHVARAATLLKHNTIYRRDQ